mmetsp:Transcript_19558/g.62820  ORF Transcript_19558/g.62820 Transcript_19558/m.62820 type:complete len:248 (+) Transcript_19558:225-968(+)
MTTARNGLRLKSTNQTFVDQVVTVTLKRGEGGLGIELEELWQSEEAPSRGLVLVAGVLKGSPAEDAGLRRGDTLVSANGVELECLSFNAVVASLSKVLEDSIELTVKRIVRRQYVDVTVLEPSGDAKARFVIPAGANLRTAFLLNGFRSAEIYDTQTYRFDAIANAGTNCGGDGTCGTCLVSILDGADLVSPPGRVERAALTKQKRPPRWRWSCCMFVGTGNRGGNLTVELRPQSRFLDEIEKVTGV